MHSAGDVEERCGEGEIVAESFPYVDTAHSYSKKFARPAPSGRRWLTHSTLLRQKVGIQNVAHPRSRYAYFG